MISIMETHLDQIWDERYYYLALKSDKPEETYRELRANRLSAKQGDAIDDLPVEQQSWLRAK